MQGNIHSGNNDMHPFPRTSTFAGASSTEISAVSEITINTGGCKNKTCNVSTIFKDGSRAIESKNTVCRLSIVQQTLIVRVGNRIQS